MLNREQLDKMRCAGGHNGEPCDHTELFFHARCHPQSPTWAMYADGVLVITCAECEAEIAKVAVA